MRRVKNVAEELEIHARMLSRRKKELSDTGGISIFQAHPKAIGRLKAKDVEKRELRQQRARSTRSNRTG